MKTFGGTTAKFIWRSCPEELGHATDPMMRRCFRGLATAKASMSRSQLLSASAELGVASAFQENCGALVRALVWYESNSVAAPSPSEQTPFPLADNGEPTRTDRAKARAPSTTPPVRNGPSRADTQITTCAPSTTPPTPQTRERVF